MLRVICLIAVLFSVYVETEGGNLNQLIIGGRKASLTDVPFQVSLRDSNNYHHCGGAIISERWILTAAHCFFQKDVKLTKAVVGTISLKSGGDEYSILKYIPHQEYNLTNKNDIALIKTDKKIVMKRTVKSINLPTKNLKDKQIVRISGFGATKFEGPNSDVLLITNNEVILDKMKCESMFPPSAIEENVTLYDTNLCTMKKSTGSCGGDSGGPIVADKQLHGLVSHGFSCSTEHPHVNTKVKSFVKWIKTTQNENK